MFRRFYSHIFTWPWPYVAIRYALAFVFIYAGAIKLGAPRAFATVIGGYGLVPESLLPTFSYLLPALEVAAGLALIFEIKGSLAAITALTLLFIAVLTYGIRLGLDVDCGCYGPHDPEATAYAGLRTALVRDAIMLCGVVYLYLWRSLNKGRLVGVPTWPRRNSAFPKEELACEK